MLLFNEGLSRKKRVTSIEASKKHTSTAGPVIQTPTIVT